MRLRRCRFIAGDWVTVSIDAFDFSNFLGFVVGRQHVANGSQKVRLAGTVLLVVVIDGSAD